MSPIPRSWPAEEAHLHQDPSSRPETRAAQALPDPDMPEARHLVVQLTGIGDPSPTFIREIFSGILARTEDQDRHALQILLWEEHVPGVNDLMSGAIHPATQGLRSPEELAAIPLEDNFDNICSASLPHMEKYMPNKLFNLAAIASLELFNQPEHINLLPSGFHTTVRGLRVAHVELFQGGETRPFDDNDLYNELLKVGGTPRDTRIVVLYPEDLVPCVPEEEWSPLQRQFWEEIRGIDFAGEAEDEEAVAADLAATTE